MLAEGIAVEGKKETGYGSEIAEEKSNCSRQAFTKNVQDVQDEIICLFRGQNDESDCQSFVSFGQTQSHGLFGQE